MLESGVIFWLFYSVRAAMAALSFDGYYQDIPGKVL